MGRADFIPRGGLLDSTLAIALGEFGRTPQIDNGAGRDHWSNAMSVLFAGSGTPGGTVVGATNKKGFAAFAAFNRSCRRGPPRSVPYKAGGFVGHTPGRFPSPGDPIGNLIRFTAAR